MPISPSGAEDSGPSQPREGAGRRPAGSTPGTFEQEPHRARVMAESFGTDPARYDRTRPRYPAGLIARLAGDGGREVLDVGTGTGIVARQLTEAGCRVLGLDVDARMAAYARGAGLDVEVAPFEEWDPAGRRFDTVVAGQTWHWIDPVAGPAKAAGVLRPGGRLAVFWNVSRPAPEVARVLESAFRDALPDAPLNPWSGAALGGYTAIVDKTADGIRAAGAFGEPEEWRYEWECTYTRDAWLDQVPTGGGMALLNPAQRTALLDAMAAAADDLGGSFVMGYTALAVTAVAGAATGGRAG